MNDMKKLVENFPVQLREAIEIGSKAKLNGAVRPVKNILITGLGGSGIGGTIATEIVFNDCSVPIIVNKDYFIPAFVNEDTLVVVCSYSGNTEETVQAFEAALKKNAMIACVSLFVVVKIIADITRQSISGKAAKEEPGKFI